MEETEQVRKSKSSDKSANFPKRGSNTMPRRPHHDRKNFGGIDKCRYIRAKLGKEVAHSIHEKEGQCNRRQGRSDGEQAISERHHAKTNTLYPLTSQAINRQGRDNIAW